MISKRLSLPLLLAGASALGLGGCAALPLAVAVGSNVAMVGSSALRAQQARDDCRNFRQVAAERGVQVTLTPEQLRNCQRVWVDDDAGGRPTTVSAPSPAAAPIQRRQWN